MQATFTHRNYDFTFSDKDVVNPSDFIPGGEYNPHNVRPWYIHDHGFCVAVVFASNASGALDEAADAGKLDFLKVEGDGFKDYGEEGEGLSCLGNAGEFFDVEGLDIFPLPAVPFSFAAMLMAAQPAANQEPAVTLATD